MLDLRPILLKLSARQDLTRDETEQAFLHIMSGEAGDAQIGGLLVGMAAKGTTVGELVGAARIMRSKSLRIDAPEPDTLLDTCGTGGDIKGAFNISTCAAILAASAGVRVVKHGNRSASSKTGSADVLEKLGVNLDATPAQCASCLEAAGICFAFARSFHPAMKNVAAARASLGIPTIFNLLGPLTNPAGASRQLLGVFAPELTDHLAAALLELGCRRGWVVHSEDGMDELSTLSPTRVAECRDGHVRSFRIDARELGFPQARLQDLQVASADESAETIRSILRGDRGPRRDIALLNAAAALVIADAAADLPSAIARVAGAIVSGRAAETLARLVHHSRA